MDEERYKRRTRRKNEGGNGNKRERKFHRTGLEEKKRKKKSPGAVYEGKSGVKYNEKGNRKGKTGKRNMYGKRRRTRENEELESTWENALMKQKRKVEEKRQEKEIK